MKKKEIRNKKVMLLNDSIWQIEIVKKVKEDKEEKTNMLCNIAAWMTVLFFPVWLVICEIFSDVNEETMRTAGYFCLGIIIGFDICSYIAGVIEAIENEK